MDRRHLRLELNFICPKCYGSTPGSNPGSVGSTPTGYANYGVGSSVVERRFVVPHVGSSILLLHPSLCVISSAVEHRFDSARAGSSILSSRTSLCRRVITTTIVTKTPSPLAPILCAHMQELPSESSIRHRKTVGAPNQWSRDRVADCDTLERCCTSNRTVSSNLTDSATNSTGYSAAW